MKNRIFFLFSLLFIIQSISLQAIEPKSFLHEDIWEKFKIGAGLGLAGIGTYNLISGIQTNHNNLNDLTKANSQGNISINLGSILIPAGLILIYNAYKNLTAKPRIKNPTSEKTIQTNIIKKRSTLMPQPTQRANKKQPHQHKAHKTKKRHSHHHKASCHNNYDKPLTDTEKAWMCILCPPLLLFLPFL